MTDTTRCFCPLDCGWHYDRPEPDPTELAKARPDLTSFDIAQILIAGQLQYDETAVREHMESHSLIEWVQALTTAQRSLAQAERITELARELVDRHVTKRVAVYSGGQQAIWCDGCNSSPEPRWLPENDLTIPLPDCTYRTKARRIRPVRRAAVRHTDVMAPTTTEAPARPTLADLAALGAEELTAELGRALPGNEEQQPRVAAFNSSI